MVRSLTLAFVVAGLGWTGLAWAQSTGETTARPRFITVREEGKSPQRCQIVKTWHEPNGVPVYQVRAVDSGEVMTIVGSPPSSSTGTARAMTTRIFHWNGDSKPPAGAPIAPAQTVARPTQSPSPLNLAPTPQPRPIATATRTPEPPSLSPIAQPPATTKPQPPVVVAQPTPGIRSNPPALTPLGTQVIQQKSTGALPTATGTPAQPRLLPTPHGTAVSQTPCDCPSGAPCATNGKPCETCSQSTVCCPPSPMRQPFIGRLFKSKRDCDCKEIVCEPAKTAPKAAPAVATAQPVPTATPVARDPRESWGKVEPWTTKPTETVAKRADPVPVQMEKTHPDPVQNPELFRNMTNVRPKHSTIVDSKPPIVQRPPRSPAKVSEVPADESNAFWTATTKSATPAAESAPFNAFDRGPNGPRPNYPPRIAEAPRMPVPPPGPTPRLPVPPPGPYPTRPAPMQPARLDVGVPDAMGNAFTVAGTRRPIPADFGGTPQLPNAFAEPAQQIEGEGTPPRGYATMPAMPNARQPMPNAMAMLPMPAGANPLMTVPPTQVAYAPAPRQPTGVPYLLATLKDSLRPSERERAAEQLSDLNWKAQPLVVEHLVASAQTDPATSVRAACVHALAQMKANSKEVVALVEKLKSDSNAAVRHEAEEAYETLGVQPASHK